MRTALVTGGSGFVGGRLIEMLTGTGWTVRGLARSTAARHRIAQLGGAPIDGDLHQPGSLAVAVAGCDVIFHAAAHFKLWGDTREFHATNVEGTRHLLAAASASGTVARFVQIGAAAVVMGDLVPMLGVDESLPLRRHAWAPYSSSKASADELVRAANSERMATMVVRPPMIWGKGMPMLDHIAASIAAGRFRWVGDGSQPMSTAHVDNVCHAAVLASERGRGGEAYFVSDGGDGTLKQVISDLLRTRGIEPPRATSPLVVAWAMARLLEGAWRISKRDGEPPITRQMLRLIGMPFTLDIRKAARELHYRPLVTRNDGLTAMHGI